MKQSQILKKDWWVYIVLLALVILVRMPAVVLPISNDIGANSYGARLILQGEPLYGTFHPAHHLPAIYYHYALIFALLGDDPKSLQVSLIFWIWLNALILWQIGKQISTSTAGILAAIFYVLIASMTNLNGDQAEIELFANMPIGLAIWLGGELIKQNHRLIGYGLIGVFCAVCFLYKAVYLAPLAAVSGTLLLDAVLNHSKEAWLDLLKRVVAVLAGFVAVLGLVAAYFSVPGLLPRLWLVFQLGSGYIENSDLPWYYIFIVPSILVIVANWIIFLLGWIGTARIIFWIPKTLASSRTKGLSQFMVLIWLLGSFLSAGSSKFGYGHYGILLIPPLSLLVGAEIAELWKRIPPRVGALGFAQRIWLPGLMTIAVIGNMGFASSGYLSGFLTYSIGKKSLEEFVLKDTALGVDNMNALNIARYIERNTKPDDRIFTWTELAQIPYLANRRSSSDVLWPLYIATLGPPERVFDTKPVYVVVGPSFFSDRQVPGWLSKGLEISYQLETSFDRYQVYRRVAD